MAKKPDNDIETTTEESEDQTLSSSQASTIVDSIEKNRMILIISFITVVALLCLFLVLKQMGIQKHLQAGEMFTSAAMANDISKLEEVVKEYPDSISAGNALLTKAKIQIDQGKSQDAIETLKTMASDFNTHPRNAQAYFMLANIYHKSDNFEEAKANYNKVLSIQPDGEYSPITKIRLGDIALAQDDKETARQTYEKIFVEHPGTPFLELVDQRLAQLKLGNPPVVDAPKPPEEPKKEEEVVEEAPKPAAPEAEKAKGKAKGKGKAKAAETEASKGDQSKAKGKAKNKGKAKAVEPEEVEAEVEVVE